MLIKSITLILLLTLFSIVFLVIKYKPISKPLIKKFPLNNRQNEIKHPTISILSWNVHKEVNERIFHQEIMWLQKEYSPDFLLFQEANVHIHSKEFLNIDYDFCFAPNIVMNFSKEYSGLASGSKESVSNCSSILSEQKEPFLNSSKVSLITKYNTGKEILYLINIHAINFTTNMAFEGQINKIFDTIDFEKYPTIFAGDFNTWNKNRFEFLNNKLSKYGFRRVIFDKDERKNIKSVFGNNLDHIYYSKHFKLQSCSVIDSLKSSDHVPLYAKFLYTKF